MKPAENHIRERIIEKLREQPYGLPILEIARLVGSHRHTITKYVYELVGAGIIRIRKIGTANVCILDESLAAKGSEKQILKKLKERSWI